MILKFKAKIKNNGHSLKWFYDKYVKKNGGITYGGFSAQLNGYAPLSELTKIEIIKYLG